MKNLKSIGRILEKKEMKGIFASQSDPRGWCACSDGREFPVYNCGQCIELCNGGFFCVGPIEELDTER